MTSRDVADFLLGAIFIFLLGFVVLCCFINYLWCAVRNFIKARKEKKAEQKKVEKNTLPEKLKEPKKSSFDLTLLADDMLYAKFHDSPRNPWRNGKVIAVELHDSSSWMAGAVNAPTQSELRQRFGIPRSGFVPLSQTEFHNGAAITPIACTSLTAPHLHLRMRFPHIEEHTNCLGTVDYNSLENAMVTAFVALFRTIRVLDCIQDKTLLIPLPQRPISSEERHFYNTACARALVLALARFVNSEGVLSVTQCLGIKKALLCCYDQETCNEIKSTIYKTISALDTVQNNSIFHCAPVLLYREGAGLAH